MPKSPSLDDLKTRVARLVAAMDTGSSSSPAVIRAEVVRLAGIIAGLDKFTRMKFPAAKFGKAAPERIREYLKLFVGQVIDGDELRVISGIQEFGRRIRQLRVEEGYNIVSGMQDKGLRPDQYKLISATPDEEKAEKWRTSNRIRRMKGGSAGRVLAYLQAYVGQVVESKELLYVAKKKDYDRRARALRSEKGWHIRTRGTGSLELTPTQYVLDSLEQLPEHDRNIDPDVFDKVLKRDGHKCVRCGWGHSDRNASTKAQHLQVHHKELHGRGGSNKEENLATLCNVHHVEVHKKKVDQDTFDAWVKS